MVSAPANSSIPTCKPEGVTLLQHSVVVDHLDLSAVSALNLKQVQAVDATETNLRVEHNHEQNHMNKTNCTKQSGVDTGGAICGLSQP